MGNYLYLYWAEHEFTLMYVTPVHYHMIIIVSPLVYNTLLSTVRNLTPIIYHLFFIPVYHVQCYQKWLYQIEYSLYIQSFVFSLTGSIPFPTYFVQQCFPPLPSAKWFHTFAIHESGFVTFCLLSLNIWLPKVFLNLFILGFPLCVTKFLKV